jgi:hypothetical protein
MVSTRIYESKYLALVFAICLVLVIALVLVLEVLRRFVLRRFSALDLLSSTITRTSTIVVFSMRSSWHYPARISLTLFRLTTWSPT